MRRMKHASTIGQPRGQIVEGVSIRDRPADLEDRAIPDYWEGDLSTGTQNRHMATLVEHASHFTNVQVYFCVPQSPWQRGTNESTNRLLRQYFPKGTDLSRYSQADLNKIALRLNQRPRKTLGFRTPAAILAGVATTG